MARVVYSLKLPTELIGRVKAQASAEGRSVNALCEQALTRYLGSGNTSGVEPRGNTETACTPARPVQSAGYPPPLCQACGHHRAQHYRPGQCAGTCACRRFQDGRP